MILETLRLQLRLPPPFALVLIAAAYTAVPVLDRGTLRWFERDLGSRITLLANAFSDAGRSRLRARIKARMRRCRQGGAS